MLRCCQVFCLALGILNGCFAVLLVGQNMTLSIIAVEKEWDVPQKVRSLAIASGFYLVMSAALTILDTYRRKQPVRAARVDYPEGGSTTGEHQGLLKSGI
jgi:hypothetical protein